MKTVIIGATGFIGRELARELKDNGHVPVAVTRNAANATSIFGHDVAIHQWDGRSSSGLLPVLEGADAIVNLAGASIGSGRWTKKRKKILMDSRVKTGKTIVEAVKKVGKKPSVMLQASAIGIYGTPVENPTGENGPKGKGFLADMAYEWENSIRGIEEFVPRVAFVRTGLVLGKNGGLMDRMMLPFRFYSGAVIGNGKQWMSWIHLRDQVRAMRFILENNISSGAYNLTAPNPVHMSEFITTIARVTGKPAWLKVPDFVLRMAFGEMAGETILASQNIYPEKLLNEGFRFEYTALEPALTDLLKK